MSAIGEPMTMVVLVTAVVVVGGLVRIRRRRRVAGQRAAVADALPESIELCIVVLGSGGTLADCLRALAVDGPPAVQGPTAAAAESLGAGIGLGQALRRWQVALGPSCQPLTGALLVAADHGGSIGPLLDRLALEAAAARRRRGEQRARRLPVLLLGPLVGCSLPAVIIGALVPLALVALGSLLR